MKWEYKCGPLTINFRILVEPKGFLRIIMLVIALLAFSTTAGFNSSGSDNEVTCITNANGTNGTSVSAVIKFNYPYGDDDFSIRYEPNDFSCRESFDSGTFSGSAQYFVAMGVLTMIYVIAAIFVYMLFITPELFLAKWLVIGDLILTIVFGIFYLMADISWSAGIAQLNNFLEEEVEDRAVACLECDRADASRNVDLQTFAQPAISVIFGWLATFIWFASIWFVYKDTVWHRDRTGPLASLYQKKAEETGEKPKDQAGQAEAGEAEPPKDEAS